MRLRHLVLAYLLVIFVGVLMLAWLRQTPNSKPLPATTTVVSTPAPPKHNKPSSTNLVFQSFAERLALAAEERCQHPVTYDGSYQIIDYPGGDVAAHRGVCSDVVIRSYRALGIDLQVLVHEDMTSDFTAYPQLWQLRAPDPNIDHRRVPNLMCFFTRQGAQLNTSQNAFDYQAGDIVAWRLSNNLTHIGIVSNQWNSDKQRRLIVHNIGSGPELDDCLFAFNIIGHYRFTDHH